MPKKEAIGLSKVFRKVSSGPDGHVFSVNSCHVTFSRGSIAAVCAVSSELFSQKGSGPTLEASDGAALIETIGGGLYLANDPNAYAQITNFVNEPS